MNEKIVLITGANSGIGLVTASHLAEQGAGVVLVCRNSDRGATALKNIARVATGIAPTLLVADLSSQASIRSLANDVHTQFDRIDVLVNNAGAVFAQRELTVDGIEKTFATNHLAPFLLTNLLLDRIQTAPSGRILLVSSKVHNNARIDFNDLQNERRYSAIRAYEQTKLENILFTYALAKRLADTNVTVNCLAPGLVASNFGRNAGGFISIMSRLLTPFSLTPEEGARTSIYLASSPEVAGVTGKYFFKCHEEPSSPSSYDSESTQQLWKVSENLTRLGEDTPSLL
ncbi:MAG: SDR family oxidoreductase [Rhizonema sp. PD38]|nr:SDR family oxidoreductase [Rhizonema sp. PD38]